MFYLVMLIVSMSLLYYTPACSMNKSKKELSSQLYSDICDQKPLSIIEERLYDGANPNAVLHKVIAHFATPNMPDIAQLLMQYGGNPGLYNKEDGKTCFHYVAENINTEACSLLLESIQGRAEMHEAVKTMLLINRRKCISKHPSWLVKQLFILIMKKAFPALLPFNKGYSKGVKMNFDLHSILLKRDDQHKQAYELLKPMLKFFQHTKNDYLRQSSDKPNLNAIAACDLQIQKVKTLQEQLNPCHYQKKGNKAVIKTGNSRTKKKSKKFNHTSRRNHHK